MPWDNLKTVHAVTKETLWEEYRIFLKKILLLFLFWGTFLFCLLMEMNLLTWVS